MPPAKRPLPTDPLPTDPYWYALAIQQVPSHLGTTAKGVWIDGFVAGLEARDSVHLLG